MTYIVGFTEWDIFLYHGQLVSTSAGGNYLLPQKKSMQKCLRNFQLNIKVFLFIGTPVCITAYWLPFKYKIIFIYNPLEFEPVSIYQSPLAVEPSARPFLSALWVPGEQFPLEGISQIAC